MQSFQNVGGLGPFFNDIGKSDERRFILHDQRVCVCLWYDFGGCYVDRCCLPCFPLVMIMMMMMMMMMMMIVMLIVKKKSS